MQKIARRLSRPVHVELFVEQHARDEARNNLFKMLHRPEIVEGPAITVGIP